MQVLYMILLYLPEHKFLVLLNSNQVPCGEC